MPILQFIRKFYTREQKYVFTLRFHCILETKVNLPSNKNNDRHFCSFHILSNNLDLHYAAHTMASDLKSTLLDMFRSSNRHGY